MYKSHTKPKALLTGLRQPEQQRLVQLGQLQQGHLSPRRAQHDRHGQRLQAGPQGQ